LENLTEHEPCRGCPQHRDFGSGCSIVEAASGVPLDEFLRREPCFLKDWLRRFGARFLEHRPRSLLDPDDLVQDVATRLLGDPNVRAGGFGEGLGAFLAYLRRTATSCAISAERRELGRIRCGNCKHYGVFSGRCLEQGHAWTHRELAATQDPRALEPACRSFAIRRAPAELTAESEASLRARTEPNCDPEIAEQVIAGLVALAELHPRAALVVRARLLEGRTYETLAHLGASVRTLKRDYAFGLAFLRKRLAVFAEGQMAPSDDDGRYEEHGPDP
jgi:DNA-directed RNA polymerase specialized sigma24 family protein